jgi:hypothetical protein
VPPGPTPAVVVAAGSVLVAVPAVCRPEFKFPGSEESLPVGVVCRSLLLCCPSFESLCVAVEDAEFWVPVPVMEPGWLAAGTVGPELLSGPVGGT